MNSWENNHINLNYKQYTQVDLTYLRVRSKKCLVTFSAVYFFYDCTIYFVQIKGNHAQGDYNSTYCYLIFIFFFIWCGKSTNTHTCTEEKRLLQYLHLLHSSFLLFLGELLMLWWFLFFFFNISNESIKKDKDRDRVCERGWRVKDSWISKPVWRFHHMHHGKWDSVQRELIEKEKRWNEYRKSRKRQSEMKITRYRYSPPSECIYIYISTVTPCLSFLLL